MSRGGRMDRSTETGATNANPTDISEVPVVQVRENKN